MVLKRECHTANWVLCEGTNPNVDTRWGDAGGFVDDAIAAKIGILGNPEYDAGVKSEPKQSGVKIDVKRIEEPSEDKALSSFKQSTKRGA